MMMEHNLKPCPFCGGEISLEAATQTPYMRQVHMRCRCCEMDFIHRQDFAISRVDRVAIGRSFEDIWNGRADK